MFTLQLVSGIVVGGLRLAAQTHNICIDIFCDYHNSGVT